MQAMSNVQKDLMEPKMDEVAKSEKKVKLMEMRTTELIELERTKTTEPFLAK